MLTIYRGGNELTENVEMEFNLQNHNDGSFVLPVCIEAQLYIEGNIQFLVKENNGKILFSPDKSDAKKFDSLEAARNFINEVLKPRWGEKWTFWIWSHNALVK
jgi:hypothetical protein